MGLPLIPNPRRLVEWLVICCDEGSKAEEGMISSSFCKVFLTACRVFKTLIRFDCKRRRLVCSLLVVVLLGPNVQGRQAQTADWQAVENLGPGTLISVKTQHRFPCFFASATDEELVCNGPRDRLLRLPPKMIFPRGEIRGIRTEHNQAKVAWIGAGMGAGVGAAVGASTCKGSRGGAALIGVLGGALVGAVVGSIVPIFRHGKIIYRR